MRKVTVYSGSLALLAEDISGASCLCDFLRQQLSILHDIGQGNESQDTVMTPYQLAALSGMISNALMDNETLLLQMAEVTPPE